MKNFKVIVSLIALIAVSNADALTPAQKKEFESVITDVENGKELTTAQMGIINKYVNKATLDSDIDAGIDRLTRAEFDFDQLKQLPVTEEGIQTTATTGVTTGKGMTLAQRRKAAQEQQPVTGVKTAQKSTQQETKTVIQPTTTPTAGKGMTLAQRQKAAQGQQPVTRVETAPITTQQGTKTVTQPTTTPTAGKPMTLAQRRKAAQETKPTTRAQTTTPTKGSIFEKEAWEKASERDKLPVGVDWDNSAAKIARMFYSNLDKTIKIDGFKKYVNMVKEAYPELSGDQLRNKVYENASAILREVRNEKELDKKVADQLNQAMRSIVPASTPGKYAKELLEEELLEQQKTKALLELTQKNALLKVVNEFEKSSAKTLARLEELTKNNPDSFYFNEKLNPDWFSFAQSTIQKNYPTKESAEVKDLLTRTAQGLLERKLNLSQNNELETTYTQQIQAEINKIIPEQGQSKEKDIAMRLLQEADNFDNFMLITNNYPETIYKNDQIQQDWFDLAVKKKLYEFKGKDAPRLEILHAYIKTQAELTLQKTLKPTLTNDEKNLISNATSKALENRDK